MDLSTLFGGSDAANAADAGNTDFLATGTSAALGFLEDKAIGILSADKQQQESKVQAAVQNQIKSPSAPGSFGSYFGGLFQSAAIKQYSPEIMLGVAALMAFGYFYFKGR